MFKLITYFKSRSKKIGVRCYQSKYLPWLDPSPQPNRARYALKSL